MNKLHFNPFVSIPPFPLFLIVILYNCSFSSASHAWSALSVQLKWTCLYTNGSYEITDLLIFPEGTLQLTLHDSSAVHFHYSSTQWTEFVLFLYQLPYTPTSTTRNKIQYLILNLHLRNLYKAPRNFQKQLAQTENRVPPVPAPTVKGRRG